MRIVPETPSVLENKVDQIEEFSLFIEHPGKNREFVEVMEVFLRGKVEKFK